MTESPDETMTDPVPVSDSCSPEQWSLYEILTPLAEKLIQDLVNLFCILYDIQCEQQGISVCVMDNSSSHGPRSLRLRPLDKASNSYSN